jgi:hypothetical protein
LFIDGSALPMLAGIAGSASMAWMLARMTLRPTPHKEDKAYV